MQHVTLSSSSSITKRERLWSIKHKPLHVKQTLWSIQKKKEETLWFDSTRFRWIQCMNEWKKKRKSEMRPEEEEEEGWSGLELWSEKPLMSFGFFVTSCLLLGPKHEQHVIVSKKFESFPIRWHTHETPIKQHTIREINGVKNNEKKNTKRR